MSKLNSIPFWLAILCCCTLMSYVNDTKAVQLSGTYRIDASLAAGTDSTFGNLSSAIAYLTGSGNRTDGGPANSAPFGVSGPVVFSVSAGTYTEQVGITGNIPGSSTVNTITFDGGNAGGTIIQFAGTTGLRHTILLNNTRYINLKNLTVKTTGVSFGHGIVLTGNSASIRIKHCVIDQQGGAPSTISSGTDFIGILVYGSANPSSILATGGTNSDSLEIDSNVIANGIYGIVQVGLSTNPSKYVYIRNNTLSNIWYTGIISQYTTNLKLTGNQVRMAIGNRTSTQNRNVGYGINLVYITATSPDISEVSGNLVLHPVNRAFLMSECTNPAGSKGLFVNNMIGGGFQAQLNNQFAGLMVGGCQNWLFAHNTIVVDRIGVNTSIQDAFSISAGTTPSSGLTLYNNIIARTSNMGTPQRALYIANPAFIDSMDYNQLYVPDDPTAELMNIGGSSFNKSNFRNAFGFNAHSIYGKPALVNDTNLHLVNRCNKGLFIAGVGTDIDQDPRGNPPAIGADEGISLVNNIELLEILQPVMPFTSGTHDLKLLVRNSGSNTVTGFTAAYRLNSAAEVSSSWSGTLNACDTVTVTFSNVVFSPGSTSITAYTRQPNGTGDSRTDNDTLSAELITQLGGNNFTINPAFPTGGTNFASFSDAAQALRGGISGPVTFQVAAGTYNEQFAIDNVIGSSPVNTITFDGGAGNAATRIISFSSTSTINTHTVMIASKYVRLRNLSIYAGGTYAWALRLAPGSDNTHVKNCILKVTSPDAATSGSSNYGCIVVSHLPTNSLVGCRVDSLEIDSNEFYYGLFSFVHRGGVGNATGLGYSALASKDNKIRWNYMYRPSGPGVLLGNNDNPRVIGNTIIGTRPTTAWDTDPPAINLAGCTSTGSNRAEITGNRMYDIGKGIEIQWSSNPADNKGLIANNMIGGIYVRNTSMGIEFTNHANTANWNVFNNSVNLNSTGSNNIQYAAIGVLSATSSGISIYNNILCHKGSGIGLPLYIASPASIDSMDYNQFYKADSAEYGLAYIGRSIEADSLAGAEGFNQHAVIMYPSFVNDTTLHLTDGCTRGISIPGLTTDIDGQPRSAAPNIGADEFSSPVKAVDLSMVHVVSPGPVAFTSTPDLVVRIKNTGTQPLTYANITYQLNSDMPVTAVWTGNLLPCDTVSVYLGMITPSMGNNTLLVYSASPNGVMDSVPLNDTLRYTFTNATPLQGTYTIGGTGASYPDFASAVTQLLTYGVSGHVVFNIQPGSYNERVNITGPIRGTSDSSTIIFDGIDPATRSLNFTGNGSTIYIQGATHITLRNLSINASTVNINCYGVWLSNASYTRIKNCRITLSGAATTATGNTLAGILINGSTSSSSPATGGTIHGVEIDSNIISYGYYGIAHFGINNSVSLGNKFRNNTIRNSYYYGIYLRYHSDLTVTGNNVRMRSDNASSVGIYLQNINAPYTDQNTVMNNQVSHFGQYGIQLTSAVGGTFPQKGLIANNAVGGVVHQANAVGIALNSSTAWKIVHNSVNMPVAASSGNFGAFQVASGSSNTVLNNVFACTRGGFGVPVYLANAISIDTMDYNMLVHSNAQDNAALKYVGTEFYLASFRGGAGFDSNSVASANSPFMNDTNLVMADGCSKGIFLPWADKDLAGITRVNPPSMGAYEANQFNNNIGVSSIILPSPLTAGPNDLHVVVSNNGSNPVSSYTISYRLDNNAVVSRTISSVNLLPCENDTVVFSGANQLSISAQLLHTIRAFSSLPNNLPDARRDDDTLQLTFGVPMSGTYTLGTAPADFQTFTEAASALRVRGISGPVTINVTASLSFTESPVILEKISGAGSGSITFRKNGSGANPVLYGRQGTGSADAIVTIRGLDSMIFDGIDLADHVNNTTNTEKMEFGYLVTNASSLKGSSANTITNCSVSLDKANTLATYAIAQTSSSALGTAFNAASYSGGNHLNTYRNIRISNTNTGIVLQAMAAYPDSGNVITATPGDSSLIGGPAPGNLGATGILLSHQSGVEVSNTWVRNLESSSTVVTGIYLNNAGASAPLQPARIMNNRISNLNSTSTSATVLAGVYGIRCDIPPGAKATVANNVVYNLSKANATSASVNLGIRGIAHCPSGTGDASYLHNTVDVSCGSSLNLSSAAFSSHAGLNVEVRNNLFSNSSPAQSGSAAHHAMHTYASMIFSSGNLLWSAGNNGYLASTSSNNATEIAGARLIYSDPTSVSYPVGLSASRHLKPDSSSPAVWALNGRASFVAAASTDISGKARPATPADGVPDIGAYEIEPVSLPPLATAIPDSISPFQFSDTTQLFMFAGDTVARIKWTPFYDIPRVEVRQYSGAMPPNISPNQNHMFFYTSIDTLGQPTGFGYDLALYYRENWIGTNPAEADLYMAKQDAFVPWSLVPVSSVDTARNILYGQGLYSPALFSGTDLVNPMPVKLTSFNGKSDRGNVILYWSTASESDNKGFEVLRSADGKRFEPVAFVEGKGKLSTISNYTLTDAQAFAQTGSRKLYYRLRQLDGNGHSSLSGVIVVGPDDKQPDELLCSVFPNPFSHQLSVRLYSASSSQARLEVFDLAGKKLFEKVAAVAEGENLILLNEAGDYRNGIYFIRATLDGQTKTVRVIRQ